jgi:sugar transferase (PEP-CTERM system associated)
MEENILIIGSNPLSLELAEEITANRSLGYRVLGFVDRHPGRQVGNPVAFEVLGNFNDITRIVEEHRISRIVVSVDERRGRLPMDALLECRMKGVEINEDVDLYEKIMGKILVDKLRPSWLIFSTGFDQARFKLGFKRVSEFVVAAIALVVLFPLTVLIALAIKLESPGPVLFRQERVGQNDKVFTLYKFRSMHEGAEETTGPVWAADEDERVTPLGRFLRKSRLDEIPQLINVVRGDMSFVGPRPERPYFVKELEKQIPYYVKRHAVKPGITGWAQVRYSYGASVEDAKEKLQYDLYYIKNLSILLDIEVIIDTFKVVFLGKGAR